MQPVRVRYNRLWAPAMFAIAAINAALFATSGGMIQLSLTTVFTVLGALYLTRPILVIDDEAICAKSLIGYTVKRIPHGSFAGLEVANTAIVLGPPGRRQRLSLSKWMVSQRDLDRLGEVVRDARAAI